MPTIETAQDLSRHFDTEEAYTMNMLMDQHEEDQKIVEEEDLEFFQDPFAHEEGIF